MAHDPKKTWKDIMLFDDDRREASAAEVKEFFHRIGRTSKQIETIAESISAQAANVARIPDIVEKADRAWRTANDTHQKILVLNERQVGMNNRLERIEKNGHPCKMEPRVQSLERFAEDQQKDQEEDAVTRAKVKEMDKTISAVQDERKAMSKTVIGIIVTVLLAGLGSGGSAIWFIRGLQSDLELEVHSRQARDNQIKVLLKNITSDRGSKTRSQDNRLITSEIMRGYEKTPKNNIRSQVSRDPSRSTWHMRGGS